MSGPGWSYTPAPDEETPATLTLNNYTYTSSSGKASNSAIYALEDLVIELEGTNNVDSTVVKGNNFSIYVDGQLTIQGNGTLNANAAQKGIYASSLLSINGCTVDASSTGTVSGCVGIYSSSEGVDTIINNATVKANTVFGNAIDFGRDVIIEDSIVEAHSTNDIGIYSYGGNNVEINDGSHVIASGGDKAIYGRVKNEIAGTGWENADGSGKKTDIAVNTSDEGQTLDFKKVQFPAEVEKVTVTFDSAGGSAVAAQTIEKGAKATKPADPTRSGYTFDGWYNGNTAFDFNTAVNESITLTAHWKENAQPAPSGESSSAPESAAVLINTNTVNANTLNAAAIQSGASVNSATVVVLGKNVKKISKGSFKNFRNVKTLVVQSKKLKKSSVKKALKGSAVKNVKVQVGKKKTNKKYVKKYKRIFTKKNCGRKVKVSL